MESILYQAYLDMDALTFFVSLAPSFILDVSPTSPMRPWFTPPEWEEVIRAIPPMPVANQTMVNSLVRFFPARTAQDLRTILSTTSFLPHETSYDRDKHYYADWADATFRHMYLPLHPPYL